MYDGGFVGILSGLDPMLAQANESIEQGFGRERLCMDG